MKRPALILALIGVASLVAVAAYTKESEPGADIRNPKTVTKIYYDRVPEFTCPDGQRVVWVSFVEIGCEWRKG